MTVNTTIAKEQASGNGSTTSFSFPYPLLEDDDLLVTLVDNNGAAVSTVLDGAGTYDYSISGTYDTDYQGYTTGVNCVFNTAPPSGYRLTLSYSIDIKQATDYVDNDDFPANSHERALDKLTLIAQQMNETLDRSIKMSVNDTSDVDVILPASSPDAVIGVWNSDASAIVAGPTATEISNAEANANIASAAASTATSAKNDAETARDEAQATVGAVRVSANDTTADNLEAKLLASGLVGLSTQNNGGNETRTVDVPVATQAEAEGGTDDTKAMTPLRTAQAIAELAASELTTQGDMLFRGAADLERLAIGNAGEALIVGAGGEPEWGPAGRVIKMTTFTNSIRTALSATSSRIVMFSGNITKERANTDIYVTGTVPLGGAGTTHPHFGEAFMKFGTGSDIHGQIHNTRAMTNAMGANYIVDLTATGLAAGSIAWEMGYDSFSSQDAQPAPIVNPNVSDNNRSWQTQTRFMFWEVEPID